MIDVVQQDLRDLIVARLPYAGAGGANHRHAMREIAALLDLHKGDQVLGPHKRHEQIASRAGRQLRNVAHLENAGHIDSSGYLAPSAIDHGQLGGGGLIRRSKARKEIGNVYTTAIAREGDILWKAPGG